MKLIGYLFIIVIFINLSGCTTEGNHEEITYQIENTTGRTVKLLFYKTTEENDSRVLVDTKEVKGNGILWKKTFSLGPGDIPIDMFNSNLLVVVFDDNVFEEHTSGNPENSIMEYIITFSSSNNYTYKITEENFNNAIPCDGPCD